MHSNRLEHSLRRQHSDRSSRQWDDYDDRWEDRHDPHRDIPRDSYHKYSGDGHSSTERTSRSREYSTSPKRRGSKDSVSRDWNRKSPVRRCISSPDWSGAEKKRQRYTDDDDDDDDEDNFRYRRDPVDKTYRQSPDNFSNPHGPKDFKHRTTQEEDFKLRKTSQDSRHRHRHEEFTYRQQHDDSRLTSRYYKDSHRQERRWDRSEERTRSQECSAVTCGKPRESDGSPSPDHRDHHHNRTRFPLTESHGQSFESDVTSQSPTVPEQKSTRGFQRFLDVLNRGVNVATLTKIVTQTSPEVGDRPHSPGSFTITAVPLWSPSSAEKQQGGHQNNHHWNESEGSHSLASPQPHHRSFSPQRCPQSDEKSLQRSDRQSHFSLNSRSRSPSVVGKISLTPEDEHKHRQMQDVLQAIGMDLGSEELGQMTHRIQERLYGKKDSDRGHQCGGIRERDSRRAFSPRRQSRSSSSSRSNFSSLTRDSYVKKDSCSALRDETQADQVQVHEAVEYGQNGTSSSLRDSENCETNSQQNSTALQTVSPSTTYSLSEPPLTPTLPTCSQVNCSPLPFPTLPPALPPSLPHIGPRFFWPPIPSLLPYPHIPPLNIVPAVLAQTRHLLPQNIYNPQSSFLNLPNLNPVQPLNTTQKSKTQSRPRCLQVIETKQPG